MPLSYGLCMAGEWIEIPDPEECSHEEWEHYTDRVDLHALNEVQAAAHREALDAYGRRLDREQAARRGESTRRLDERDQAFTDAETLSEQCRVLRDEVSRQWDVLHSLRSEHGGDDPRVVEARREYDRLSEELSGVTRRLIEANERAVQAFHDAR